MDYTELEIWKKSRTLVSEIYQLTSSFPKEEIYGLTNQIRRAAVSVPSNIAEGNGRGTSKDSNHFNFIARGSIYELETQLFIAFDLGYISEDQLKSILDKISECKKILQGFINYLNAKQV